MENANPMMITLARESRGYTQTSLAKEINVSQGEISKVENGQRLAHETLIEKLSECLSYPKEFFYQSHAFRHLPVTFYRKRVSIPATKLKGINASINILCLHVSKLLQSVDIPECQIPFVDLEDDSRRTPESVAFEIRVKWNIPPGPIDNLTQILEDHGVLIFPCDFGTDKVDGISIYDPRNDALPPMIFINPHVPACRLRYTMAHELGHLILHHHLTIPGSEAELEADRFAAEFLMPEIDIKGFFRSLDLPKLARLKPQWKVSMQALLKKACDLGEVSERKKRTLWVEMGKCGYRKKEPVEIPAETPSLRDELVRFHMDDLGYDLQELSKLLVSESTELCHLYNLRGGVRLYVV